MKIEKMLKEKEKKKKQKEAWHSLESSCSSNIHWSGDDSCHNCRVIFE
ncbi:MAG: hypothetical protein LBT59_24900 [Clostridiales bacterium]|nr:hypothetical protein [Clostridiales bacterium]